MKRAKRDRKSISTREEEQSPDPNRPAAIQETKAPEGGKVCLELCDSGDESPQNPAILTLAQSLYPIPAFELACELTYGATEASPRAAAGVERDGYSAVGPGSTHQTLSVCLLYVHRLCGWA